MDKSDSLSAKSLLERIQQGDRDAVLVAYEQHFTSLYRYVRLRVPQAALAEDIVSDVFVTLLDCIGKPCAPRQHLRGWLFKVARTQLQAQGTPRLAIEWEALEEWMPTLVDNNPEHLLSNAIDMSRLHHALQMLNSDHQEVLLLRFGQQMSLQETADMLGKSLSAVKSIQFRALQTLRQILNLTDTAQTETNSENGGVLWNSRSSKF